MAATMITSPSQLSSQSPLNTLFRGSSVAVKVLGSFGSISAAQFFPKVVTGPIKAVVANQGSLQILASKAGTGDNTQLAQNRGRLILFSQMFLDVISKSVNDTPRDLRKVFKVLHEELAVSLGKELAIIFSVNILFLRFICPIIVKPSDHQIFETKVSPDKTQDLIMIAKVLQTLANFTRFGGKEEQMSSLNPFLEKNTHAMRTYFLYLIDVGEIRNEELNFEVTSTLDSEYFEPPDADAFVPPSDVAAEPTDDITTISTPISPLDSPAFGSHRNNRRSAYFNPDAIQPANFNGNQLPEGYIAHPEYPVFKGVSVVKKAPSSVVVKQVNQLLLLLGPQFRVLLVSDPNKSNLKDFELKVCRELHSKPETMGMISKIFSLAASSQEESRSLMRKPTTYMESSAVEFLKALLSNDMVLLALIFDLLQFSNMGQIVSTLVYIFNDYNRMSRLVRFSVAHELVTVYRKWENKTD